MNRERAKELLPIIQAFADGKDILYDGSRVEDPAFDDEIGIYEINPEPEVVYVNEHCLGRISVYSNSLTAVSASTHEGGEFKCIAKKFIEAPEE